MKSAKPKISPITEIFSSFEWNYEYSKQSEHAITYTFYTSKMGKKFRDINELRIELEP